MADIQRCEEDNPHRCQAVIPSKGQCLNLAAATEGGKFGEYCLAHGGNRFVNQEAKISIRNYQLDRFKARLERHATSPHITNLRDEIGILRMVLEERLNRCNDDMDLLLHSGPISDLVSKIDKVVTSCHKLEGSMGNLLDKQAILQFASEVIEVVDSEIKQTDVNENWQELLTERIGNRIMDTIGRLGNESIPDIDS